MRYGKVDVSVFVGDNNRRTHHSSWFRAKYSCTSKFRVPVTQVASDSTTGRSLDMVLGRVVKIALWDKICFGAKYGKFLAAQKLPNLETSSCLQVVAPFGNIEVYQNWQPQSFQEWKLLNKSKISKIGNFLFARIGKNRKFTKCGNF